MHFSTCTLLFIAILTPKAFAADVSSAKCEIENSNVLHCSNIRANSPDYFKSIEIMIPKYLQKIKKGNSFFGVAFSKSDLEDFPDHLLQDFNIIVLGIHGNTFHTFPPDFLMGISSGVMFLQVENNDLILFKHKRFLDELPFASTVEKVVLKNCRIRQLQPYAFRRFTSLEDLDLSRNIITQVGTREFADHPILQLIDLSNNDLAEIEEEAFINLPNLWSLDLSSNKIMKVHPRAFVALERLRNLNLVDNRIFVLEEDTFNKQNLPKLYDLQIADNQLVCDCDLQWFRNWLQKRDMLEDSDAICVNKNHTPFAKIDLQCS